MNQMNKKSNRGLRELFFTVIFSLLSATALFFGLAYLFFQIPNFDDYYSFFPIALLTLEGLIVVLFCRRFSAGSVAYTLVSSTSVSLISLLSGFACFGFSPNFPRIIAMHFLFIAASAVIQIAIQKKRPSKSKKLPFKK